MMKKLLITSFVIILNTNLRADESLSAHDIATCQEQANAFGSGIGKGKAVDYISKLCVDSFKSLASPLAVAGPTLKTNLKAYGFKNMVLVEKNTGNSILTNIIAGKSTELKSVQALVFDEKNQELVVLDNKSGVLFFTSKYTGNIAPFRILSHPSIAGASEIQIDTINDQIIVKTKKSILFFSRLANVNGIKGKQKLDLLKSIDISQMNLVNMTIDSTSSKLSAIDQVSNKKIDFDLNKLK